jgi:hypothetical protein
MLAACLLATFGCGGGGRAEVSGRLRLKNGAPLIGASLIARNDATGKSCYGVTDSEGKYELQTSEPGDGVAPGTYSVSIVEARLDRDAISGPTIAAKYSNPSESGLTLSVAAGESKALDVTLDSP